MEKVRIGVIGCGGMGQAHIKSIKELPEAELAAVCDVDAKVLDGLTKANNVKGFADSKELTGSGLVDAVVIATPHYFHPTIAVDAFEKGLHVLSEKPISVTVSAADIMLRAAKKSGKVFAVMYQQRTLPAIRLARQIIRSGKLGKIIRTMMVEPNYRCQAYYNSSGWRATWTGEGGGVLINQAPHGIDLFMLLGGMPVRVNARVRTKIHDIEVEDEASAMLEYENGTWGYYYTSTCEMPASTRMEISGDRGKLVYVDGELKLYMLNPPVSDHNKETKEMWSFPQVQEEQLELPKAETGHKEILRNFCAAILRKEELISPGEDGMKAVEFINAVCLSGRMGKPVDIPVDRRQYDMLLDKLRRNSKEKKEAVKTERVTDPRFK
ncbi:hypothetical protein COY52_05895 [Candidatus Desantisbacteria bacterium CG_4_10_14_0_8_um_filter_48_22]|uniref:Oxidoreductase n=1 Tax=Candidatus Desantisbacteria bacterium CG_4_10_14_0_8_um_filter_48_22 TaxID=1974543 RepID=A0A2M7SBI7_9BACT|nr:MAG: hypothetical protein AUJ67_08315 [Candidatus Desantisbacteria bacterium CG1_02_49_89]PIV55215.1 MAG: hypothetical protein COS16_07930 [Candidatus Desantisbacteria bacterium CG02_land_8_20_14_3_00_49_13]PIZ16861.1 MAG: hypothetical protein COY52_05895 [Candidatus Desantisbacteria bacterium CG_4_10_14_0_8_um_filter_48_22]